MDKVKNYQKLIVELFEKYAAVKPANLTEQEYEIIADTQRNHFQLLSIGWHNNRHFCNIILHIDIKNNGHIWLQANNTDWDITTQMIECGVPKSDIVLGTIAPRLRAYSDFAVA